MKNVPIFWDQSNLFKPVNSGVARFKKIIALPSVLYGIKDSGKFLSCYNIFLGKRNVYSFHHL